MKKEGDIHVFLRLVEKSIKQWPVPVVGLLAEQGSDPFKILIACILSLRTRDQTTAEASERLFAISSDPYSMSEMDLKEIEMAIFPVGFFRTKARQIQAMSQKICDDFDGKTPDTIEDLLRLPGVGRKTANLVLTLGHKKPGICVDTHVHRICNRWGYVVTKTPEQTEQVLRETLPKKFWIPINGLLVSFGQNQCTPISPWCSSCSLSEVCKKVGVVSSR
jgi:endonuclease III